MHAEQFHILNVFGPSNLLAQSSHSLFAVLKLDCRSPAEGQGSTNRIMSSYSVAVKQGRNDGSGASLGMYASEHDADFVSISALLQ